MRTSWSSAVLALLVVFAAAVGLAADATEAGSEGFRIENKVFVDNAKEPHAESTTIFYHGVVYDYLKKPAEITVFDGAHRRFILLDTTRRVQTEVSTDKVVSFLEGLQRWVAQQSEPFVRFLGEPEFEERFDEASGELSLSSPWMTYRLATIDAESEAASRQYREFSDWYCRLNTLVTPGARPPFARLLVNAALEKRQRFPTEVELTIRTRKGIPPKKTTIRGEHQLVRRLVESDRDRVAQTGQFMAIFKSVDFREYQAKVLE
jgi:hypothetical protein